MESDFLSDMFELNEAIMEENSPEVIKRIGSENRVKIQQLEAQLGANFKQNDYEAAKKSVAELKYYINVEKIVNTKLGLE